MVTVNDYLHEEKYFKCLLDEVFKRFMTMDNVSDYVLKCYVFFRCRTRTLYFFVCLFHECYNLDDAGHIMVLGGGIL